MIPFPGPELRRSLPIPLEAPETNAVFFMMSVLLSVFFYADSIAENNRKIYCPGIGIWYNETMIFEDIKSL